MNSISAPPRNPDRDPFGLAQLSTPAPPADAWPEIEAALGQRHRARRSLPWLAIAAAVILAVGVYWQLPMWREAAQPVQSAAVETPVTTPETEIPAEESRLGSLMRLSQTLENNLRLVRNEVGAMPARSVIYQVELEDLVTQLDEAINQNPESVELWSQRVNLLLDLNQLYRTQLRRDYSHLASL